jgi:hypothetical protein
MVPEHRKVFTGQAPKLGQAILLRKRLKAVGERQSIGRYPQIT